MINKPNKNGTNNYKDAINRVSTNGGITHDKNPMQHQNLSTVIRWYKDVLPLNHEEILFMS
ncbi:MAG: hypothetical protein WC860_06765 [Candidatus Margulisiibacteriota bacterium]|jgi:hypothetical protein